MTLGDRLDALISGFRTTQVVRAAAIHDVAGVLAAGSLDAGGSRRRRDAMRERWVACCAVWLPSVS